MFLMEELVAERCEGQFVVLGGCWGCGVGVGLWRVKRKDDTSSTTLIRCGR